MDYSIIKPCRELQDIIGHYWVSTWDADSQAPHELYYAIASSSAEITFAFSGPEKDDELLFSIVQGHGHSPMQYQVKGFYHLIGVSLPSYVVNALFKMPSLELSQEFIPLSTFLGKEGDILNEKIADAETTDQRIAILNGYFKGRMTHLKVGDSQMISAIQAVKKQYGNPRVMDLANSTFLSQKQFNRRFREFSGFNPKMYSRIIRLETAIKCYPFFPSLTELAHSSGYFDQAHFIREFKKLTGFSPRDFWRLSEK